MLKDWSWTWEVPYSSRLHVSLLTSAGGSTQLTWLLSRDGKVESSPAGSVSLPYGAAALTQRLSTLNTEAERGSLASSMTSAFQKAYEDIKLPSSLLHQASHGGLPLYLSGGGFRGWGYILMSSHKFSPYPIPIINGFSVGRHAFAQTASIAHIASKNDPSIFRVSKRRASQIPAVAFLVDCLMNAIPCINTVHFCQGGVREGFLFDSLPTDTKAQDPLCSATTSHGPPSADKIAALLYVALPPDNPKLDRSHPRSLSKELCRSIADIMYLHASKSEGEQSHGGALCANHRRARQRTWCLSYRQSVVGAGAMQEIGEAMLRRPTRI